MSVNLNRMRLTFSVAAHWLGWSAEDQTEFGESNRAALDTGNAELLEWWAAYLEQASGLKRLTEQCRAAEARIRADAEKERAAA
jgi:hypothetical protein